MTDGKLWQQARRGDEAAWRRLYERYLPTVWRYVCSRVGRDREFAEDVVSETFLALVRLLASREAPVDSLVGWLLSVARRRIDDQFRRNGRREAALVLHCEDANPAVADAAAQLEQQEARTSLWEMLDDLPADERLVLEWKYLEGLSVQEIASRMGRTEKAVESLLFRARRAMRDAGTLARRASEGVKIAGDDGSLAGASG